ncbi:MAG: indolepyruvate ferredoxin oxidoreductase subunit alpha [Bacilli bacterium]|nr:indolepyruvate ferredoxin oxidoreductase subunit alpha [Bacilli bacterium]
MKKLMLANKAIARGAYEAGVRVLSAYPGTPSTEIAEEFAKYEDVYAEWAPNEKVALEVALGASIAGARSMVSMKHVGLNVASDAMFSASYSGVNAGLVIVVADDPGMHSSQNEQDTRLYGVMAHVPVLEVSNSQEAKDFMKIAFELSEEYDTPVIVRTTTRVSHSQSYVEIGERVNLPLKKYVKCVSKYVMYPATARGRHVAVEARETALKEACNNFSINKIEMNDTSLGVICAGILYEHVKEALPSASILKLGMVYPLPIERIKEFAKNVDKLLVVEENEPYIEKEIKALGITCLGRDVFSVQGEITASVIKNRFLGEALPKLESLPPRPPILCAGCPHRGVFYVFKKLKLTVIGDVGCYTLAASEPLAAMDTMICMGAALGMAHGFVKATDNNQNIVSVIGDSTFIHNGITGLINAVYNKANITLVILDNDTTGMTGHQDNPATGKTLQNEVTNRLDLEALVRGCGVKRVCTVDAYDISKTEMILKEELKQDEVSVIIAKRPCIMLSKLKKGTMVVHDCKSCMACFKLGCPAIIKIDNKAFIDQTLCVDCGLCVEVCPFDCIKGEDV